MATPKDLDVLITAVRQNQNKRTVGEVIRALNDSEVFYRATVDNVGEGQRVTTPLARLSDGSHALVVYTSKSHPDLPTKFSGAPWRHVLRMAAGIPDADWLIVSAKNGDWLPMNRKQIDSLATGMELAVQEPEILTPPANARLETLISQMDDSSSTIWTELLEGLNGCELFLRISSSSSEDGRPVLITSEAGGVHGLVQAYTSRTRPGIAYGGMTWEALVTMIKSAPEIPGVQIINDNDDWVVLGRSEI